MTAFSKSGINFPNRITSYNVCYTKLLRIFVDKVKELFSFKEAQELKAKEEAQRQRQAEREARKNKNRNKGWER